MTTPVPFVIDITNPLGRYGTIVLLVNGRQAGTLKRDEVDGKLKLDPAVPTTIPPPAP